MVVARRQNIYGLTPGFFLVAIRAGKANCNKHRVSMRRDCIHSCAPFMCTYVCMTILKPPHAITTNDSESTLLLKSCCYSKLCGSKGNHWKRAQAEKKVNNIRYQAAGAATAQAEVLYVTTSKKKSPSASERPARAAGAFNMTSIC